MGQFQGRVAANVHTRRNPLCNGFFRGTDGGLGLGMEVILFQIHSTDYTFANRAVQKGSFYIYEAAGIQTKNLFLQISVHSFIDLFDGGITVTV